MTNDTEHIFIAYFYMVYLLWWSVFNLLPILYWDTYLFFIVFESYLYILSPSLLSEK